MFERLITPEVSHCSDFLERSGIDHGRGRRRAQRGRVKVKLMNVANRTYSVPNILL